MMQNLLVPVDGSDNATKAVRFAADLASKYEAQVTLFHVLLSGPVPDAIRNLSDIGGEQQPGMAVGAAHVEAGLPREVLEDIAAKLLERDQAIAHEHGAHNIQTRWTGGGVTERILEHAHASEVDTIVVGARGLSSLKGLIVGSVSHKVQHLFTGTVITVK